MFKKESIRRVKQNEDNRYTGSKPGYKSMPLMLPENLAYPVPPR